MKTDKTSSVKAHKSRLNKGVWIIIIAAVLLELLSAVQYYSTRQLLSDELEQKEEMGLRMKAIVIKNTLNAAKSTLYDHIWDMQRNLEEPDSMFSVVEWLVRMNHTIKGGGMAFIPDYYPQKGRLFEPYARRSDSTVLVQQIAGENHDYTQREFYYSVLSSDKSVWTEPYEDKEGAGTMVTTYSIPIHKNDDDDDKIAGAFFIDLSLDWLSDTLNSHQSYPSSFNLLLTEDGKLISRPAESHVNSIDVPQVLAAINDSTIERHSSKSSNIKIIRFESENDGADGSIFYANMKGKPHWQIVAVSYDEEVYAPLMRLRVLMLMVMLAAFAILGFIIHRFARNAQKLGRANLKQERINSELRIASHIQQTMLPNVQDEIPDRPDIQVSGILLPAKEVGGDLYSFFIRDEKLFFCIGDVSGKGVPSALVMSVTQALFRNAATQDSSPAHIMQTLNTSACRNNTTNMFVTLFVGVLDLPSGRLRYCNAGHDVPVIQESCTFLDVQSNLPVGVFEDFHYVQQETLFDKPTTLFLYTDGLTEARNQQRKLFGSDRLIGVLADNPSVSPSDLLQRMTDAVKVFTEDTKQSDDLTMLAIRYTPLTHETILKEELTLTNDIIQVQPLNKFVDSVAVRLQLEKSMAQNIKLAVEEAVVNVMSYAYPMGTHGEISVQAIADSQQIRYIITDKGKAFDPTKVMKTDTALKAEDRPIGGLGILLVRELMDSVNYEYVDGRNILTLGKKYNDK